MKTLAILAVVIVAALYGGSIAVEHFRTAVATHSERAA